MKLMARLLIVLFVGGVVPLFAEEESRWKLVHGKGELVPPDILQVVGDGTDSSVWQGERIQLQFNAFYRFSVSHRGVDADGGRLPCGIEDFTREYRTTSNQWTDESFIFRVRNWTRTPPSNMRVGQQESLGTFQFRNIKLERVVPVIKEFDLPFGKLRLGEGESICDGKYRFRSNLGGQGTNTQQPCAISHDAPTFNSNRWVFGNGVVYYRFSLKPQGGNDGKVILMSEGKLTINVKEYTHGEGVVGMDATSGSGTTGMTVMRINKVETKEIDLPFFPTESVSVAISGRASDFHVDRIDFEATLPKIYEDTDLHALNLTGETLFAVLQQESETLTPLTPGFPTMVVENSNINFSHTVGAGTTISRFFGQSIPQSFSLTEKNEIKVGDTLIPLEGKKEITFEHNGLTFLLTTEK